MGVPIQYFHHKASCPCAECAAWREIQNKIRCQCEVCVELRKQFPLAGDNEIEARKEMQNA